jgi:hypothetical protein
MARFRVPRRFVAVASAVLFVPVLGLAVVFASKGSPSVSDVRAATAKYHDVNVAKADGYGLLKDAAGIACIDNLPTGTMGVHYVKAALLNGVIDPLQPEALVYEPKKNGDLKLVAVEYVMFQSEWKGPGATPSVLGQSLRPVAAPNRYGIPAFFQRHAWIWANNPLGMFEEWNNKVSC